MATFTAAHDARVRLPLRKELRLAYGLIAWIDLLIAVDSIVRQVWVALVVWTVLAALFTAMAVAQHRAIRRDERTVRGEA